MNGQPDEIRSIVDRALNGKQAADPLARKLGLTPASTIKVRPVRWLWEGRVPLGSLTLLGGREGIGKSTIGYTLAAQVTRGTLPGVYFGQPRAVIVAATEDSWEHTIVPRLMAAEADLDRVYRVDVTTEEGVYASLTLPVDLLALENAVNEVDAALILLDPLLSRLSAKLDTHKDAEVRIALEPLTTLADRCGAAVIGLIHVNKGTSSDPLTLLMASRAFAAVARAVLFVMKDPDDENKKLMGTPKNNLGRTDLPTLCFAIVSEHVATTDEGEVWTGRVDWLGESERTIDQVMEELGEGGTVRSATTEAAGWLEDHLTSQGGSDEWATIKTAGARMGHAERTLQRAGDRLHILREIRGFPRASIWSLRSAVEEPLSAIDASGAKIGMTGMTEGEFPLAPTSPGGGITGMTGTNVESGELTTLCVDASGASHASLPRLGANVESDELTTLSVNGGSGLDFDPNSIF